MVYSHKGYLDLFVTCKKEGQIVKASVVKEAAEKIDFDVIGFDGLGHWELDECFAPLDEEDGFFEAELFLKGYSEYCEIGGEGYLAGGYWNETLPEDLDYILQEFKKCLGKAYEVELYRKSIDERMEYE